MCYRPAWLVLATTLVLGFASTANVSAGTDEAQGLPDLVAKINRSVVTIQVHLNADAQPDRQGSGWFRSPSELVTNRHVVAKALRGEVRFSDGRTAPVVGILADDPRRDLAILSVSVSPAPNPIPIATRQPRAGEKVFTIGTPLGLERTVSEGIVSSIRSASGVTVIQTTAAISPGSSGSPLRNMSGEVIGVATAQFEAGQLLNFAVSVDAVTALKSGKPADLSQWSGTIEEPKAQSPEMTEMADIERALASFYGVPPNPGVLRMKQEEYLVRLKQLHSSFTPSFEDLQRAIKYGGTQSKREYGKVFDKYNRKAGDDLISPFFPNQSAVCVGWSRAREYKPLPDAKEVFPKPSHFLQILVQMSRKNRPKELVSPKFVLQTGKDAYIQPAGDPKAEDIKSRTYMGSGVRSYYNYFTKRTEYYTYTDRDTYFSTAYMVTFDLLGKHGIPVVKPEDKELTLILVLQGEEKKVKFKLDDWSIEGVTGGKN